MSSARSLFGSMRRAGPVPTKSTGFLAFVVVVALGQAASAAIVPPIGARAVVGTAELRRDFPLDEFGVTHPDGRALISNVAVFAEHAPDGTILTGVTTAEDPVGTMTLPPLQSPITAAFDPSTARLALLDQTALITLDTEHLWRDDASIERRSMKAARIAEPRGAAFLPDGGFAVLDGRHRVIVVVDPATGDVRRHIPVMHLGARLRGLARGPTDGLLALVSLDRRMVYTIDGIGTIRGEYELTDAPIRNVSAIAIGPSADPTDAADAVSLFAVADTGRTGSDDLVELSLRSRTGGEPQPVAAVTHEVASLIQTIDLSRLSPSSPDPSGIAYLPTSDDFVVSDGEVEEMPIYRDANLFRIDRTTRALVDTGTTAPPNPKAFSKEPVGAAFDPATATLIISDDDEDDIALVRAGSDGRYGTHDDTVSEFDVRLLAGSVDAEGVAFDTHTGHIFVADGLGSEVYHLDPGPDRIFASGDDVTSHWDMDRYGTHDPEGIAYNAASRTLLVLDKESIVYEVDKTGVLLRTIDCSAADAREPAGLEVAPSSTSPSVMSLWIVDRGVDNFSDSSENDGRLFEMTLGTRPPAGPPTVQITSPADRSSHGLSTSISFAGSARDARDGTMSGALAWASNRDGAIGTGGSFTRVLSEGTHTITASATDSDGDTGSAAVTLTVQNQLPRITITSPSNRAWFASGSVISFGGTATDPEDGTVTSSLTWTSNVDGAIGTGGSFTTNLRDGLHTITASATDSRGGTGSALLKIAVGTPRTVSVTLATGSDDAEEIIATGAVDLTSNDLDLVVEGSSTVQRVGLRFKVTVPPGARVTKAYVQFRTSEVSTGTTSLSLWGQASDNAPTFTRASRNIATRALTNTSVPWNPPPWHTVEAAGPDQRTPNIAPILQEIFARPGWASGNGVVLVITGAGRRTADSFEGPSGAPVLHIEHR